MSRQRFTDQVVFVTGGTSGLGAATAQCFIDEGAKVFVTDLEERSIVKRLGSNAFFMRCDVSSSEDCQSAIQACVDRWGRIDVLFHAAARPAPLGSVVDHDVALFHAVVNTTMCSAFYLAKYAIPHMRKQKKGSIINVASISGLFGDYGLTSYNAAKAGVMNLTRSMALDHAGEGIRINGICPGYMRTPMSAAFNDHAEIQNDLAANIPLGRGCDPIEVARTALFLASDDASYMTGHALVVDGGVTAASGMPNWPRYFAPQPIESNGSTATTE